MELKSLKLLELKALAKSKGIHDAYKYKKDELILKLNEIEANEPSEEDKEKIKDSESLEEGAEPEQTAELPDKIVEEIESSGTEALKVTGILETHTDGYGFLRIHNYLTSDDDVYISPSQIRRFHMQTGDKITGITRPPKQGEKFKALLYVILLQP
jgi:transcription termination factor Rho